MSTILTDRVENYAYPVLANILGRETAQVVEKLHKYVSPKGDYVLVRSDLDVLDEAFRQLETHLSRKYAGQCWSRR